MDSETKISDFKSIPSWKFHLFLSFRGKDTRQSFTDYLHNTLQRNGFITFRDNDQLERGEVISEQLLLAIEESLCAVVVLSPNYASSSWCLDELVKIHECKIRLGREILPIFYDIEPSEVAHQRGSFGDAFIKHEQKFEKDRIQRWRYALRKTADLFGWKTTNRQHTGLIEEITAELQGKLQTKLLAENSRASTILGAEVASSSNSFKSSPQRKFQVFLSFRGEDTRGSFIDYLHATLQRSRIITFKDFDNLEKGEYIKEQLLRAIEGSFSAIVVLSPHYGFSAWCLMELTKILECQDMLGMEVFPIFYDVEPYEVRYQKGSFGVAFERHERIFPKDRVKKWRHSLHRISSLSGWISKDRHQTELIEEVISDLRKKLLTKLPSYNDGLVGTDSSSSTDCLHLTHTHGCVKNFLPSHRMSRSRSWCRVLSSHSCGRGYLPLDVSPPSEGYYENPALAIPTGTIISTQGSSTAPPKIGTPSGSIDNRIYVQPEGMELLPSPNVCHIISEIINAKFTKPYLGWNEVPQDTRDLLWDEFEKECRWDPNHHAQIKKLWELKCADIIRALLASIHFDKVVGSWLSPTVLADLWEQWAKDSSKTNKDNLAVTEGECVNRASFISISGSQRRYESYEKLKNFIDAMGSSMDDSALYSQDMGSRRNKRARAYGFGSEVAFHGLSRCSSQSTSYPCSSSNDEISLLQLEATKLQSQLQEHQAEKERLENIESQYHNISSELATLKDLVGKLVNRVGVQPAEGLLESHSSHSMQK